MILPSRVKTSFYPLIGLHLTPNAPVWTFIWNVTLCQNLSLNGVKMTKIPLSCQICNFEKLRAKMVKIFKQSIQAVKSCVYCID